MAIEGLMHIGVYTKDMTESIRFYTEILGFRVQWKGIVDHVTGQIEAAKVVLGDCIVELVKPANLENVRTIPGPVQHIALKVTDLSAVMDQLTAKGVHFADEVRQINFDGGIRHCFLFGPSNERIELAEYDVTV